MRIVCIAADAAGGSCFSERDIPADEVRMFPAMPPFHRNRFAVPVRQLAVALDGTVEYETTDGACRRFGPGQPVLVADTEGKGHVTRFLDGVRTFLHIPVPEGWPDGAMAGHD